MKKMRSRSFWLSIGLIITDIAFFGLTNPVKVASILLIAGFGLLVVTMYWLLLNIQKIAGLYMPWLLRQKNLSLSISLLVGLLLALQSIGQLTVRDMLLVPAAGLVLYAYLAYGKKDPARRS